MAVSRIARHDGRVTLFDRRPSLRWAVPAAAVAVIAASALVGSTSVSADAGLEPRTPAELLVAAQNPTTDALSGTVEVVSNLGLPVLPGMSSAKATGPLALATGTHTLRVWADGPDLTRVALIGAGSEYDVLRNGADVWTWSSTEKAVTHTVLDPRSAKVPDAAGMPRTPQEAADLILAAVEPDTDVTVTGVASVAGRSVYELTLTPRQSDTLVARATLAIDAETGVALRAQVFSTEMPEPALQVGFTSVDLTSPDPSVFAFAPPAGATVTEPADEAKALSGMTLPTEGAQPRVVGQGWSQVVIADLPADALAGVDSADPQAASALALIEALPAVSGPWGTGRVFAGPLLSVIITDDGRVALGAVAPTSVSAALATP